MEKVQLTLWEVEIFRALQARQPGIVVSTLEEARVISSVLRVAQAFLQLGKGEREITRWTTASHVKYSLIDEHTLANPVDISDKGAVPPLEKALKDFVNSQTEGLPRQGILLLCDIEPIIERNYSSVRVLRESLCRIRDKCWGKTIVVVNKDFTMPNELRSEFMRFELPLPDVAHLIVLAKELLNLFKNDKNGGFKDLALDEKVIQAFATACSGLTETETRTHATLSLAKFKVFDERAVALAQREKARILLQGGALTMQEPRVGFADVGGLENAKLWVQQVTPLVEKPEESRAYGLRVPSGLLLCGCPGVGKSLLAEALAKEWRLPLLRFDVGACFGKLVGESEGNVRRMIEMAASSKPCVVFIDEIEKALGGDSLDGGTTSRVKSTLLTWLQEKPDSIFVVATANDLTRLESMPELIRSGRFDQKFFVDLPDAKARADIFAIHLRRTGHEVPPAALLKAARATAKYSGAEIEVVVQQALRFAFGAVPRRPQPSEADLLAAIREVKPLADTMAESIKRLRAWCADGRAKMAGATLEDDDRAVEQGHGGNKVNSLAADIADDIVKN